jgi:hypothetical protein
MIDARGPTRCAGRSHQQVDQPMGGGLSGGSPERITSVMVVRRISMCPAGTVEARMVGPMAAAARQALRQPANDCEPSGQQGQSEWSVGAAICSMQGTSSPCASPSNAFAIGADSNNCAATIKWITGRRSRWNMRVNIGLWTRDRQHVPIVSMRQLRDSRLGARQPLDSGGHRREVDRVELDRSRHFLQRRHALRKGLACLTPVRQACRLRRA